AGPTRRAIVPKQFEYSVTEQAGTPARAEPDWTPEHLVLAGLARCTLASLEFHAKRADVQVAGSARADGVVAKREEDGRFAFVEIECALDVELDPAPEGDRLTELLGLAERDCFVGASLTMKPSYEWRVNGEQIR
ncbi:MAG: OsmC family protein, partial [Gaiellales bacterium]